MIMMSLSMMKNKVIVFDLEDTLYKEIDFLKSGYHSVADYLTLTFGIRDLYQDMWNSYQSGEKDVFQKVLDNCHLTIDKTILINIYRYHKPQIDLDYNTKEVLRQLKRRCHLALITDGRSETKRNIIEALGVSDYIDWSDIYISDEVMSQKTEPLSFQMIMNKYPNCQCVYVGDNTEKDFVVPNLLGWDSYCLLDDGLHIHKQDFTLDTSKMPQHMINNIIELLDYV